MSRAPLLERVFRAIGEANPGDPQFSFGMLLKQGASPRVFSLACLAIPLTKLSHGPHHHSGDQWWPMPPERDVLLERGSALEILGTILKAAESTTSKAASASAQTTILNSETSLLSPDPDSGLLQSTFISYGGPDEAFARKLNDALEKRGVRTFFFKDDAAPGEKLHRVMRKGVNEHDRTILICSESSLQRPGLLNELEETLARESRDGGCTYLIPIRLDDYVISSWKPKDSDVAQALRDRVIADFREHDSPLKFEEQLARLIAVLKQPASP